MGDFSGFSHIIFDLDGVLLDTEPLYTRATQEVIAPFGKVFDWSVKSGMMGRDALTSARHLIEKLELPLTPEEYLSQKEPFLLASFPDSEAIPGAEALVAALKDRGLKLAVATSSSTEYFRLKIGRHAWFTSFDAVVCADHPEVKQLKPAPDIFLVAARELGARPEECLVIEDSLAGVKAACAAGMQVIAVPDVNLEVTDFAAARRVIRSYAELDLSD